MDYTGVRCFSVEKEKEKNKNKVLAVEGKRWH
jgi:hypothetical protein